MLESNHSNKPILREQYNQILPTVLNSGGYIFDDRDENNRRRFFVEQAEGVIKISNFDSVYVKTERSRVDNIYDVRYLDGTLDDFYIGVAAVCINTDSEIELIALESSADVIPKSKYIQIGEGFFFDGMGQITRTVNCPVGVDTITSFKQLSEAVGHISNMKIAPHDTEPMGITITTSSEDLSKSTFLYASNPRFLSERYEKKRETSDYLENLHKPPTELGDVSNMYIQRRGTRTSSASSREASVIINKTYIDVTNASEFVPTKDVPEGRWIICAIDTNTRRVREGGEEDRSYYVYYNEHTYASRREAYHYRDLLDKREHEHRLGWIIMKSDCVDLKDESKCSIINTDRFGIQAENPPFISDEERMQSLQKHLDFLVNRVVELDTVVGTFNGARNRYGLTTDYNRINVNGGTAQTSTSSWDSIVFYHSQPDKVVSEVRVLMSSGAKTPRIKIDGEDMLLTGVNTFTTGLKWYSWKIDRPMGHVQFIVNSGRGDVHIHQIMPFYKGENVNNIDIKQRSDGSLIDLLGNDYIVPNNGRLTEAGTASISDFNVDVILVDDVTGAVLTENGNVLINE